jgi:hypothetical protein
MDMEEIARWAFIAFVLTAVLMGLIAGYMEYTEDANFTNINAYVTLIMLILGVIIGFINITAKEVTPFLIATIALIVANTPGVWYPLGIIHPLIYNWTITILRYIVAFAAPAAVINAIKAVFAIAEEK